ncbi:MAG TPA: hypothetical protein VMN60_00895 [Longimicrobiales bacterium]|nr:hypothetical protein [Longimicrobiales bacterium]
MTTATLVADAILYREEDRQIQGYFLGGKYPDDGEALNVARVVNRLGVTERIAINQIAERAEVARRKARIVLTLMKAQRPTRLACSARLRTLFCRIASPHSRIGQPS